MANTISKLLGEIAALEGAAATKTASKKDSADEKLVSFLDKLAMELEEDPSMLFPSEKKEEEEEKEDKEDKEESEEDKEASVDENKLVDKVANKVLAMLEKIAVQGGETIPNFDQPNTASGGGPVVQGMDDEANIDQFSGDRISDKENPNKNDLVEQRMPESQEGSAEALQKVSYSKEEAQVLHKLASIGYEFLVDVVSDQIVQEKIAAAVADEKAKEAPQKIAKALIAKQEGSKKEAGADPKVIEALKTLKEANLL